MLSDDRKSIQEMGVSRREFLKMAAAAAVSAAVNPLQAVIIDEDLYINQRLGLSFKKPHGWHYVSVKTFKALRDEYSLASHSEVLNEEMRDWVLPIVSITKFPLDDMPGPSIVVYVEKNGLEAGESLLSVIPMIQDYQSSLFLGYEREGNYRAGRISGCESVEYFSRFFYERRMQPAVPVRNRSLCSVRAPVMYTMQMMDIPDRNITAQREFDEFIRSIIYSNYSPVSA